MRGQSASTPYSRFGIGKLHTNSNQLGMGIGGATSALRTSLFINPYNPASYTAFDSNSFVFDAGLFARVLTLKTSEASDKVNDAGLSYITMGFPVTKWWKTSLGIMPYSTMGYQIGMDSVVEHFGKVNFGYTGSGGLNKAYFGHAFQPFKSLSVGFNFGYIFGTLNRERTLSFPDSLNHFSTRMTNSDIVRNLYLDFGLQYHSTLKNGLLLTTGITFSPAQKLGSTSDYLAVTFYHNYSSNLDIIKDTSVFESNVDGKIDIPMGFSAGFSLARTNRWLVSSDFSYQQWSDFTYYGASDILRNGLKFSLGGQFKPSPLDVGTYWKRINYRMGFRFEQSNLELRNTPLRDFGISFGVGLPMKKSRSTINLAFETGTFGTTENKLIKENYFRFTLGASIMEKWFLKRKYD